jgi:hypothetical protein
VRTTDEILTAFEQLRPPTTPTPVPVLEGAR